MTDHDEFCPNDFPLVGAICTLCQRLAKARADERARMADYLDSIGCDNAAWFVRRLARKRDPE